MNYLQIVKDCIAIPIRRLASNKGLTTLSNHSTYCDIIARSVHNLPVHPELTDLRIPASITVVNLINSAANCVRA